MKKSFFNKLGLYTEKQLNERLHEEHGSYLMSLLDNISLAPGVSGITSKLSRDNYKNRDFQIILTSPWFTWWPDQMIRPDID